MKSEQTLLNYVKKHRYKSVNEAADITGMSSSNMRKLFRSDRDKLRIRLIAGIMESVIDEGR